MATESLDFSHTQIIIDPDGNAKTMIIEPGESQEFEPVPLHSWEQPASDDAGAPSTDAG